MENRPKGSYLQKLFLPVVLFTVAFIPRIVMLHRGLTCDEPTWIKRSSSFISAIMKQDFDATFQSAHPGVTTMWSAGSFIWFRNIASIEKISFLDKLVIGRLAIVLLTSVTVAVIYWLVKSLYGNQTAILGALLVATDPFFLAHSRIVHVDGLLASFMALSVLSLLVYTKGEKKLLMGLSGVFAGLAFLTKLPSIILIPYTIIVLLFFLFREKKPSKIRSVPIDVTLLWRAILLWGVCAVVTYLVFWPAIWNMPADTITGLLKAAQIGTVLPHESGNFFLGKGVSDPGIWFYWTVILLRSTPVTLIFAFFSLSCIFLTGLWRQRFENKITISLILFIVFFTLMMSLGAKKGDRYLLPIFLILDILAAWGMYCFVKTVQKYVGQKPIDGVQTRLYFPEARRYLKDKIPILIITVLFVLHAWGSLRLYPYYHSYYNPIVGGSSVAPGVLAIGRGEGLDLAAKYLNRKPNAEELLVASWYDMVFGQYFKGRALGINQAGQADVDYIVLYVNQIQRKLWGSELAKKYYDSKKPEKIIKINEIDYVWIYEKK